ncbi:MAG: FAD-dependent oxidoreductase, partial [Pseudonocardiaceae bacterium]|nr:FAD-dependent oxidoreductase [Pseudonocardiaceae bacterium]
MRARFDVVVVGAGQAGLAVGYELARAGRDFVLLDGASRVGAAWRSRWDSLRLFTPAAVDGLPGKAFPAGRNYRPTKDEMADFLKEYARTFDLPLRLASTVRRVFRDGYELVAETSGGRVAAPEMVIATGPYTVPRVPSFGRLLDPRVRQLHSIDYRNPGQLRDGGVLVAGAGNSGGEIAVDVAATHRTWLSGRDTGYVPFDVDASLYQLLGRLRTDRLPGRAIAGWLAGSGTPLVRIGAPDLAAAGIERVARVAGVT